MRWEAELQTPLGALWNVFNGTVFTGPVWSFGKQLSSLMMSSTFNDTCSWRRTWCPMKGGKEGKIRLFDSVFVLLLPLSELSFWNVVLPLGKVAERGQNRTCSCQYDKQAIHDWFPWSNLWKTNRENLDEHRLLDLERIICYRQLCKHYYIYIQIKMKMW